VSVRVCAQMWHSGVQCLSHLVMSTDHCDMVDDIINVMATVDALFVRCHLVIINGSQSLMSLHSAIEQFALEASSGLQ